MAKPIKPARYLRNERKRLVEETAIIDSDNPTLSQIFRDEVKAIGARIIEEQEKTNG